MVTFQTFKILALRTAIHTWAWLFLVGIEDFPVEAVCPLSPAEGTNLQGVDEGINYGDCLRT